MEGMFLALLCAGTSIWGHTMSRTYPVWGHQTRTQWSCDAWALAKVACALPSSMAYLGVS